jgi:hypothetical protein
MTTQKLATVTIADLREVVAAAVAKHPDQRARIERGASIVPLRTIRRTRASWPATASRARPSPAASTGSTTASASASAGTARSVGSPANTCGRCGSWACSLACTAPPRRARPRSIVPMAASLSPGERLAAFTPRRRGPWPADNRERMDALERAAEELLPRQEKTNRDLEEIVRRIEARERKEGSR